MHSLGYNTAEHNGKSVTTLLVAKDLYQYRDIVKENIVPLFSPPRYQAPFKPVHHEDISFALRLFTEVEAGVKGVLFGCEMCGNCILQETAFVCPMTCPKGLRNGLCGGATPEACEVDPSRPCTWYVIYERAERMGRTEKLLEINAPLDGNRIGRETWLDLMKKYIKGGKKPRLIDLFINKKKFDKEYDEFFYKLRQPDWWKGDSKYHPPAYKEPASLLEANLRSGNFVVTGEISPPLGASGDIIKKKVGWLDGFVTAANFTDNSSASARMSSIASSKICLEAGLEPIMQLQARDRSRVVIQSDAMGAAGLGIRNILCLSGDHFTFGPTPMAVPHQFDLDSIQMLWMLRKMRDQGVYLDGREIKRRPMWFLGAASSPFGVVPKYEAIRIEKKVNAGAQFIQTQPVFDIDRFSEWLEALEKRNIFDKVYILAGLVPLKSAHTAHYMAEKVPGIFVPDEILRRMDDAGDEDGQQKEGFQIALELIEKIKTLSGISGMHIMAFHWEAIIPKLVEQAELPRPMIKSLEKPEATMG